MVYTRLHLPFDLFNIGLIDFHRLLQEDGIPKSLCFEIYSTRKPAQLTELTLNLCAQAQTEGFEIIWLDILNGTISWSLNPQTTGPFDLEKSGIDLDKFNLLHVYSLSEQQILSQIEPLIRKSRQFVVIDNLNQLNLLLSMRPVRNARANRVTCRATYTKNH